MDIKRQIAAFALLCGTMASSAAAAQAAGEPLHALVESGDGSAPAALESIRSARGVDGRNQVTLEAGVLELGVSYARRLGESPWSVGAGVWGAWEPPKTFDGTLFEPVGLQLFTRYRPVKWFHTDVGLTAASYHWADDCSECTATLAGVRTVALVGQKTVFVGPELSAVWTDDELNGSRFGFLYGAQVRVVVGWGN